jgi:hypothetical protein
MTKRDQFIHYVRHGGPQPLCSPQIGAGAGFDTRLAGKEWISETTLADTIAAVSRFDIVPLINLGLPDPGDWNPALRWHQTGERCAPEQVTRDFELRTTHGTLTKQVTETRREGTFQPKYPVTGDADLAAFEWVVDAMGVGDFSAVTRQVRAAVDEIAGRAALDIQWAMQPYEMLCFPNTVDTVLLAQDQPVFFQRLMDKILALDLKLQDAVAAGGADFVFLGGPGSEMISPSYYRDYLIPYSKIVTAEARRRGLLVYTHICSPVQPFLDLGFYNEMGLDLFETLSPPPVGNVQSLAEAMTKLDPAICTRGNLGLDVLLNGTPEDVRRGTETILRETAGRKHLVAAGDYLFYATPEANIAAMAETVARQ